MIIEVAKNSGFCFGVKRAVDKTYSLIEQYKGTQRRIFTYGPLIHNETVVKELEDQGVFSVETLGEVPEGSVVLIRSHGVSFDVYKKAEELGIVLEDATCPFVEKIHKIVEEESGNGRSVIIVGNEDHPEVIGIRGWCRNKVFVVRDKNDLQKLIKEGKIIDRDHSVVAQTTIKIKDFEEVVDVLIQNGTSVKSFCTVCNATRERQDSCEETAKKSDIMLVIGSRSSSNTMKLYEIAGKNCKKSYLIETIEDLPLNEVEKCGTIGIAAGASAPECIIKEVIATMSEFITENGLEQNEMLAYMEDIEKALRLPGRGEIVTGEIIAVSEKEIVVNLGCKKDGIIPKDEVSLEPGQKLSDVFKAGEQIEAKVVKTKDDDGNILLSKKKLEVNEHWNEVNEALDNKTVVNAKVTGKVKGGVIATFKEVSGFIPLSQLSDKFTEEVDEFIGKTIPVKVIQTNPKRNRAVFSHRAVLMEEKAKKTEAFWNSIEVDDIVDGVVKRFTDYGAFV
ncbi:MAG: 4-hydroxy-3-methylbut-2-enyl diphosphate reductase, partial [Clostridiales bacterium]|nr:4-hydroxy-3-methylbut-2-enyl diphosphate reductase [Clostridiales bacterium]